MPPLVITIFAFRVVAVPAACGGEVGDGRAEDKVAGELKPTVCLRGLKAGHGRRHRLGRERQVGIEVLHAKDRAVNRRHGLRGRRHPVDAEAAQRLHPLPIA
jgi:hypothetical protein